MKIDLITVFYVIFAVLLVLYLLISIIWRQYCQRKAKNTLRKVHAQLLKELEEKTKKKKLEERSNVEVKSPHESSKQEAIRSLEIAEFVDKFEEEQIRLDKIRETKNK